MFFKITVIYMKSEIVIVIYISRVAIKNIECSIIEMNIQRQLHIRDICAEYKWIKKNTRHFP